MVAQKALLFYAVWHRSALGMMKRRHRWYFPTNAPPRQKLQMCSIFFVRYVAHGSHEKRIVLRADGILLFTLMTLDCLLCSLASQGQE